METAFWTQASLEGLLAAADDNCMPRIAPIQKQLSFDGRDQPSAVSDQLKQGKTGSWLNQRSECLPRSKLRGIFNHDFQRPPKKTQPNPIFRLRERPTKTGRSPDWRGSPRSSKNCLFGS